MNFKPAFAVSLALLLGVSSSVWAQPAGDDPEWTEAEVPPPPAFDVGKLILLDASPNSSLTFGVDPASIHISSRDGIVRYVMVASSASGARNVMYEGIRCATGEFKTYARYSPEGHWNAVSNPEWRSMYGNMPSKHALRFAKAGACDNAAPATSVQSLVKRLKSPNSGTAY
ncbi:CNP1-like family protein [Polaromonas jejuensis]|uniref:CNP1-like family protein n=1 Tax=Polaromonas jejuensis TaxID=457502 RepID=A0ABW0Q9N8_9BURK|nr:CNP1-like family protein [Polaromonas jejuensis]